MEPLLLRIDLAKLLAIAAGLSYSITLVSVRQGLRSGTPSAAVLLINISVSLISLGVAFMQGTLQTSSVTALLWFALAGCLGQGLGQISNFLGIERLGVSRNSPIAASSPVWAVCFAVLILGERPVSTIWLGTMCIVVGVFLLSRTEDDGDERLGGWFRPGILFPLTSSFAYALVPILIKFAYAHQRTPMVGVGVAFGAGTLILLAGRPLMPRGGEVRADSRALAWFSLASLCTFGAVFMFWTSILLGNISVVLPLSRLTPLWVVLISYFFLGGLERVTHRVAFAAAIVVAGGVLITASRG